MVCSPRINRFVSIGPKNVPSLNFQARVIILIFSLKIAMPVVFGPSLFPLSLSFPTVCAVFFFCFLALFFAYNLIMWLDLNR